MIKQSSTIIWPFLGPLKARPISVTRNSFLPTFNYSLIQVPNNHDSLSFYSSNSEHKNGGYGKLTLGESFKALGRLITDKVKSILTPNNDSKAEKRRDHFSSGYPHDRYPGYSPPTPQGGLVAQFMIKMVQNMIKSTIQLAQKEMESVMAQVQHCEAEATAQLRHSSQAALRLGHNFRISPPISQSSSSFSLNGVSRKKITVAFQLSGARGNGQAIATSTRTGTGGGADVVQVEVIMDSGERFIVHADRFDDSNSDGGGRQRKERIIDVEFREVKEKHR
mmetsp:Transcript_10219/g.18903  ORF Transcript_10219/g.18903 Transcript_10219/m.18903 type:complete len:279 (-) Transcript_10219:730-1566(-)